MPCSSPRWIETGAGRFLPCPRGLPHPAGGSASTTSLSRPVRASLVLRPARLLAHQMWALSRGSDRTSYLVQSLGSYHVNRQLHGWLLPPLVICAVGAHRRIQVKLPVFPCRVCTLLSATAFGTHPGRVLPALFLYRCISWWHWEQRVMRFGSVSSPSRLLGLMW